MKEGLKPDGRIHSYFYASHLNLHHRVFNILEFYIQAFLDFLQAENRSNKEVT